MSPDSNQQFTRNEIRIHARLFKITNQINNRYLAFIEALDAPSGNPYVYNMQKGEVRWVICGLFRDTISEIREASHQE